MIWLRRVAQASHFAGATLAIASSTPWRMIRSVASGVVPVADLYRKYVSQMAEQGREPVSQKALGMALAECGQRATVRRLGGRNVRCRLIHERYMAGEEFDTEPARV